MSDLSLTEKRALLARLMKQQANLLPPSFAQERLWFLDQLEGGQPAYNISTAWRLLGPLQVSCLEASFNQILHRHESLRTGFATVEGELRQLISASFPFPLSIIDLSHLPPSRRQAQLQQDCRQETRRPFDLTQAPLWRAVLFRLDQEERLLLLIMHHIISDGWSITIFLKELAALYEGFAAGQPVQLPDLPLQYTDFVLWQRQWLQGETLERQLAYWKQRLVGPLTPLELPTDRPRPARQTFNGARYPLILERERVEDLKVLSHQEGATLFMTLLAAFKVLLYRYTGQEDLIIGSPVANRRRQEFEPLIGFLVNTLVLRTNLSGQPSFRELLKRVRQVALEAYAHQDLPFERLVAELRPERDLSRSPLFQVMCTLQNASLAPLSKLSTLTLEPVQIDNGTAKFDLSLSLTETSQGLTGYLEYNTDLFEAATIGRLIAHFKTLLSEIIRQPDSCIATHPLLTEPERQQVTVEWNMTAADYPRQTTLPQLFEAQVEKTPHQVALVYEERALTYLELNQRANQVARLLQKWGVGPETLVGLHLDRSLEMVIGLLGILKAGGAYVPLDPAFPADRLNFMIEDSGISVLLTQANPPHPLPHPRTLYLDGDWVEINRQSDENPSCQLKSSHLAYVIYTSGSTGRPKGVQIEHQAVVNFLYSMLQKPGLTKQDTLLSVTTLSFDIAALELFLPLLVGAKTVLASRLVAADGVQLGNLLAASGASVMQATPTTWRLLLEAGWPGSPQLKILCGGEALSRELAAQLMPRVASLWNMYGPTETTIWSSVAQVEPGEGPVLLGPPIANTQFYVLDQRGQLVPFGVAGELHIGGEGLARGYLKRPELTCEKFIPNPFNANPGVRLYKTGDRVCARPDGGFKYLGRIDHQVKLRGYRLELGEIEAILAQHPAIGQAVVLIREDSPGDQRVVAYLVPRLEQLPAPTELRHFLQQKLPDYMIPTAWVSLQALPLTPNGKIDRKVLPAPEAKPKREFVPPQTPTEKILATIWAEVLGFDSIGRDDNFFELGGHSLLATRIISRLYTQLQVKLPLIRLFEAPTIADLAARVEAAQQIKPTSPVPALKPISREKYRRQLN
jgi:amino acid adenylation domain-containing protein